MLYDNVYLIYDLSCDPNMDCGLQLFLIPSDAEKHQKPTQVCISDKEIIFTVGLQRANVKAAAATMDTEGGTCKGAEFPHMQMTPLLPKQ